MIELNARIDTFKTNDGTYFSRCRLVFWEVAVGDYDELMLAGALNGAFIDLFKRIEGVELKFLTANQLQSCMVEIEQDVRNSYLPIGVESFDGDFAVCVNIDGIEKLVVRPWSGRLMVLEVSRSKYIKFMRGARKTLLEQCGRLGLNLGGV